ncbi:ATP-binding protein [Acidobacteriota bacterium]
MRRTLYTHLLDWKASKRRKPLIIQGARQTGKTYLLQEFGRLEYSRVCYVNFEETPDLEDLFAKDLDPRNILRNLSLYAGWTIEPGRDLVILDEIQTSNNALNSLKYFHEKARDYHIVSAGSLLGLKLSKPKSFPVGKVNFFKLYPLTFLEFLEAVGKADLKDLIEQTDSFTPYPKPFHNDLLDLLRKYYFVGGMPEAVETFHSTGDLEKVRTVHKEILTSYALDFAKHASSAEVPKLSLIWESIPAQLARENRKFIFSAIKKSARARDYENAITWLVDAGLIYKSYRVPTMKSPLTSYMDRSAFKVFLLDVGLLGAMTRVHSNILIKGDRIFREYEGAFVENYIAQQLHSEKGIDLFYWKREGKKAEIDFLCEFENGIFPLEVKAGINPKSKSLRSFDDQFSPSVLFRTNLLNLKRDAKICNIPLYAITLFPRHI